MVPLDDADHRISRRPQDVAGLHRRFGGQCASTGFCSAGLPAAGLVSAGVGGWVAGGPCVQAVPDDRSYAAAKCRENQESQPGRREQHADSCAEVTLCVRPIASGDIAVSLTGDGTGPI
jgi:hypothetical protein